MHLWIILKKTYIPIYQRALINLSQIYWLHTFHGLVMRKISCNFKMNSTQTTNPLNWNTRYQKQALHCQILKYTKRVKFYTKTYRKNPDRQTFLHNNPEHPKSLNTSILHSQTLRIKRICSKTTDFEYYLLELKERLVNQGSNKKSIDQESSKVKTMHRNELVKEKTHDKKTQNKTPLVLTYNRISQNCSKALEYT